MTSVEILQSLGVRRIPADSEAQDRMANTLKSTAKILADLVKGVTTPGLSDVMASGLGIEKEKAETTINNLFNELKAHADQQLQPITQQNNESTQYVEDNTDKEIIPISREDLIRFEERVKATVDKEVLGIEEIIDSAIQLLIPHYSPKLLEIKSNQLKEKKKQPKKIKKDKKKEKEKETDESNSGSNSETNSNSDSNSDSDESSDESEEKKEKTIKVTFLKPTSNHVTIQGRVAKMNDRADGTVIKVNKQITSGIWYCEIQLDNADHGYWSPVIGVCQVPWDRPSNTCIGNDNESLDYTSDGSCFQGRECQQSNERWGDKDRMGMELNMKLRQLTFYKNGNRQPVYYMNVPRRLYFAIGFGKAGATCTITKIARRKRSGFRRELGDVKVDWKY
ncbi:MAG: hypothetical protein EZS28_012544 [Streblomastix strix]|uniref:SPRY domain-containing protein n=1 Tax=Streblomastix strix TaxID=222440 RepID=A0A5J4WAE8_9EUKA|nr:MAG: hypothetical protein EZS28_012544 [Streblomastix strix]